MRLSALDWTGLPAGTRAVVCAPAGRTLRVMGRSGRGNTAVDGWAGRRRCEATRRDASGGHAIRCYGDDLYGGILLWM